MVYLLIVEVVVILSMVIGLWQKNTNKICKSKKRLDGKFTIVTGGTAGMGLVIATDFAYRGAKVIIAGPFKEEGISAQSKIRLDSENNEVVYKYLDLGSLDSVNKFANDILNTEEKLHILVNNAGVGIPGDFLTKDGMNFIMQVNYFGHFLLTLLLLPLLKKAGEPSEPSRIVNTASVLQNIGNIEIKNWNKTGYWYKPQIYGNSKLCLILFSRELTKKLKESRLNVVINNVDPGAVGTAIFKDGIVLGNLLSFLFSILFKNPWEGIQTALYASLSRTAGSHSGELFKNCGLSRAQSLAYNDDLAKSVWEESINLVKYKGDFAKL